MGEIFRISRLGRNELVLKKRNYCLHASCQQDGINVLKMLVISHVSHEVSICGPMRKLNNNNNNIDMEDKTIITIYQHTQGQQSYLTRSLRGKLFSAFSYVLACINFGKCH